MALGGCAGEAPSGATDQRSAGASTSSPAGSDASAIRIEKLDPPSGPGAMAPRFATPPLLDPASNLLVSWLEPVTSDGRGDQSRYSLRFAQIEGEGWGPGVEVTSGPGFFANWADLPGLAGLGHGRWLAHWLHKLGEDTYAYGVQYSVSAEHAQAWSAKGLLHDDASPTEHGFVSYAALDSGGVQAFWLDGRGMAEEGPMQLRTAKVSVQGEVTASQVIDPKVCECCSTDAAAGPDGPLVVYRDRSDAEVRDISIVWASSSGDWSEPAPVARDGWKIQGCPVNGPAIAVLGQRVAVAWFTAPGGVSSVRLALSQDGGKSFDPPLVVDDDHPLGRVDLVFDHRGRPVVSWMAKHDAKDSASKPAAGARQGAALRLRRLHASGELEDAHTVALTSARRAAGVPGLSRQGSDLVLAWVDDSEPSRLRAARVRYPD